MRGFAARTALLLLLATLLPAGCTRPPEEVRIGLIAMLSGPNAVNGKSMRDAAALAVREVESRGGLRLGGTAHPVRIIVEDDRNSPDTALSAARSLVYRDRVAAIVGPQFSANAIPVARFADSAAVVMVAPMSTNPETTAGKKFVFRIPYLDTFQGKVMARFAREKLGARTAAVLYDVAQDYDRLLAEVFSSTFAEAGGTVAASETYTTDRNTDFTEQLKRISRAKPDVLFLPNYAGDARRQGDQARKLGISAVFLGGDGWDPREFGGDPAFEGSFVTRHWDASQRGGKAGAFREAFHRAYNADPEDVAATTYDAMTLLFAAMESCGSARPEKVRACISTLRGFEGVTGSIAYEGTGDPVKSALIVGVKGGRGYVHDVITP